MIENISDRKVLDVINTKDFFGCIFGGDLKFENIGKKNIILMG